MRAPFMGGAFPFPVKYGYPMVGRVEAGPAELAGRIVFALHPHQTAFIRARRGRHALAREPAPDARGARGQYGDGAQRRLGRGARTGRPDRGGRRAASSARSSASSAPPAGRAK